MTSQQDRRISPAHLRQIAASFVRAIDREQILSTADLEKRIGKQIKVEERPEDFIDILLRPWASTQTYTMSYIILGTGIPIEIKLNPAESYSHIILKSQEQLGGYSSFGQDPFGNIIQNRVLCPADINIARAEIERISKLP